MLFEAIKNVLGVSYFPNYCDYVDVNIRKFLISLTPEDSSTGTGGKPSTSANASASATSTVVGSSAVYETDSDMDDF